MREQLSGGTAREPAFPVLEKRRNGSEGPRI